MGIRYVVVHTNDPVIDIREEGGSAHCFLYDSYDEAVAASLGDDDCYKTIIAVVGPDPRDVAAVEAAEAEEEAEDTIARAVTEARARLN